MDLRHHLLASLGLVALTAAAGAQTPPKSDPPGANVSSTLVAQASPAAVAASAAHAALTAVPHTLAEALSATFANQPALQAERAKLRATDEGVPAALSGWRPTVVLAGTAGYGDGFVRAFAPSASTFLNEQTDRVIGTAQATVTQNLYTGGRIQAAVNKAKNQVYAERANLIAQEETSFNNAVGAYVGVIQDQQLLALPVKTEQEATRLANTNNPNVINAVFNDAAAKDAIDAAFGALLPSISLQGQTFQQNNASSRSTNSNGYQVTAQLSVPVYQGGQEYSAVRQARQAQQQTQRLIDDARRTAVQNAVLAWETLVAAKASADSTRAQIRANEIALEGVEREAIVGSRTTLDVLNATQLLLTSRTTLVQNLAQVITASYAVAAAIGRLTARDLHLAVPLYDDTAYYQAVKNKWAGLADYATSQPGR